MTTHAAGTLTVKTWDEKPYKEFDGGAKLTRATVTQSFHGDIEGDGIVEYLMAYQSNKSASFVGIQYVEGRIGGRSGSFALQLTGTFDGAIAKGTWTVIPGLGTGELRDLHGIGSFEAPVGPEASFSIDYDFASSN